jgi:pyruvate dehydrogenase E2 component (dihydrolipoamide acetyltransferase)
VAAEQENAMADVVMPQMGESIFEGTITKWLKKPGDKVERDEPLFEISTDKVDAEIPAPAAGVLREIRVAEGKTVPIQTVVAVIDAAGAAPAPQAQAKTAAPQDQPGTPTPQAQSGTTTPQARPATPSAGADQEGKVQQAAKPPSAAAPPAATRPARVTPPRSSPDEAPESELALGEQERVFSSPLVRRLAEENNIDLAALQGTGAGGRVSKKDVLAAIAAGSASPAPAAVPAQQARREPSAAPIIPAAPSSPVGPAPERGAATRPELEPVVPRERIYFGHYEVQPMSVMRQRIAEHMVHSKRASPHVYSIDEADLTRIANIRAAAQSDFAEKHQTKLTFMAFFVRACVDALRDFPTVNASIDGPQVVLHSEVNIGIAVALDWGLIVPVIKNAEEKNFLGLQRAINDLAERARGKKLKPEEVQESTFSITNPGIFGGLMGLPIINQPNVAILGIGAVQKRAVVVDDAIAIRSMVYLTLSYDHRVVDGAVAHRFMGQVKKQLESWKEDIL